MQLKRKRAAVEEKKVVAPLKKTKGAETKEMQKQWTEEGDRHLKHSMEKKRKNETQGGNTMSRHQYYDEALCVIETVQSTTINDDFPQFILQKSDDFSELDFGSEEYKDVLRAGYEVYFAEEIENGTMKHFDEEVEHWKVLV